MCFTKEIWTFIFWWLITFEPLEQKQSYIPLLKVLMCGMNAWGAQWHGGIFILQYTSLKMVLLLHKTALVNFPMATTVTLLVPMFFRHFYHLEKIGCNWPDFGPKNTNYIPNKRYCPWLFVGWLNFWNHPWKSGEISFRKFHFMRGVWKSISSWFLKG